VNPRSQTQSRGLVARLLSVLLKGCNALPQFCERRIESGFHLVPVDGAIWTEGESVGAVIMPPIPARVLANALEDFIVNVTQQINRDRRSTKLTCVEAHCDRVEILR